MLIFIYCIKNIINNKVYIGSTKSLVNRKYSHFRLLKNGIHHSIHLQRAYDKYGKDSFTFFVIEECVDSIRKNREIHHINITNAADRHFGYNVYEPNSDRFLCAQETKNKIRNSEYHVNKSVAIDMYDLFGNFIKSYDIINTCAKENNIRYHTIIVEILNGKRKSYKGLTFVLKGQPFTYLPSKMQRNMNMYYK